MATDRNVYAVFSSTIQKYRVRFYNGSKLLQTVENVPYGSSASYSSETPVKTDVTEPEDYAFVEWSPSPAKILTNTDCYAQFRFIGFIAVGIAERTLSGVYRNDRVTILGDHAFQGCSALTQVAFPNATSIGLKALNGATNITVADFASVTKIGENGLSACNALETLILRNTETVCRLGPDVLAYTKINSGQGYIYVPSVLLEAYKADSSWSRFAAQIRAIEDYPEITGGENA